MVDAKSKPLSIPSWQQPNNAASESSTSAPPSQSSDDNTTALATPRPTLVEQASKFLEDESIRDASTDRKVAFLETKGLRKDEIDGLLGISRNDEATTTTVTTSSGDATASASGPASIATDDSNQSGSRSDSSENASQKSQSSTFTSSPPPSSSTRSSPPRDVPPIITYPEFLIKQSKPPPLVTFTSILYSLYGAAGLGASIYSASEYLVKPMLANLVSARHDFAQNTKENLRTLNEKLEQNVSAIPPRVSSSPKKETDDAADEEDADSITSDPTELFHRDVATQTSAQDITPVVSKEKSADPETSDPTATVNNHQKRLEVINSHLREFADAENESTACDDTMRNTLRDVHYYLDGLIYSNPSYGPVSGYGSWSSSGMSDSNGKSTGVDKSEEDAIAGFRSEIRGVKGALLSARNFPSSRGGRANR